MASQFEPPKQRPAHPKPQPHPHRHPSHKNVGGHTVTADAGHYFGHARRSTRNAVFGWLLRQVVSLDP